MGIIGNLVSGAIGGIANIVSSAGQARMSRENTDKTIAANQKLAEYQYRKECLHYHIGIPIHEEYDNNLLRFLV